MSSYDPREYPQGQQPPANQGPPYGAPMSTPPPMYGSALTSTGITRRTIRHIDVWSATKVGAVLVAVVYAVFGLFFLIFALCGALSALGNLGNNNGTSGLGGASALVFIFTYLILIIVGAIGGAITGALYAWVYNITANITGGLQMDVS